MSHPITRALRSLLAAADLPFSLAATNTDLLRTYLAHKQVAFSFSDSDDQLLAKLIASGSADAVDDGSGSYTPVNLDEGQTVTMQPGMFYTISLAAGASAEIILGAQGVVDGGVQ